MLSRYFRNLEIPGCFSDVPETTYPGNSEMLEYFFRILASLNFPDTRLREKYSSISEYPEYLPTGPDGQKHSSIFKFQEYLPKGPDGQKFFSIFNFHHKVPYGRNNIYLSVISKTSESCITPILLPRR